MLTSTRSSAKYKYLLAGQQNIGLPLRERALTQQQLCILQKIGPSLHLPIQGMKIVTGFSGCRRSGHARERKGRDMALMAYMVITGGVLGWE